MAKTKMKNPQAISQATQGVTSVAGDMDFGTIKYGKNKDKELNL